jgi:hypothetical protein
MTLAPVPPVSTRDPLKWPFAATSIWNRPVGSGAVYVPAGFTQFIMDGITADEDILILTPNAPLTEVYYNGAGWSQNKSRCEKEGQLMATLPIPADFVIPQEGGTPNYSAAILMPDGRTIQQNQPLQRCKAGGYATTFVNYPSVDLCGDGILGAHGGSGLSSIGGTLRLGELVPGGVIRHALKLNMFANFAYYYGPDRPGFRWPAGQADNYAADPTNPLHYGGKNKAVVQGSLLALKPDFQLEQLRSEPARILARALQAYGGYVVDDAAWPVLAIATERSPDGRVVDEFEKTWGFPFEKSGIVYCLTDSPECTWAKDMQKIFTSLNVIDNNGPQLPSGGGQPLAPLAPEISCP